MNVPDILEAVCERLKAEHGAHTILLYGSMADGSANADSDLDIAAFAPVDHVLRIAEVLEGTFIDAFVYPETVLDTPDEEHLRFRGARILLQQAGSAASLLARLNGMYAAGPKTLPVDELEARRTWARKMVARMKRGDAEGNYRRSWLLTALLEDYFHLRGRWFEGPKKALAWLHTHDPTTFQAVEAALEPGAPTPAIEAAVEHVLKDHSALQAALQELDALGIKLPKGRVRLDSYGDTPELERELLDLIKSGTKTASASLAWAYRADGSELPCQGDIEVVLNSRGQPELVTQVDSVQVTAFSEVTPEHAALEGEGDRSLESWRESHWPFFSRECERIGRQPSMRMPIICTTFKVLHVVNSATA